MDLCVQRAVSWLLHIKWNPSILVNGEATMSSNGMEQKLTMMEQSLVAMIHSATATATTGTDS
jgi:uncharacterized membrane protein